METNQVVMCSRLKYPAFCIHTLRPSGKDFVANMHTILSRQCRRTAVLSVLAISFLALQHLALAELSWGPFYAVRTNAGTESGVDSLVCICPGNTPGVINSLWVANNDSVNGGGDVYRARSTDYGRTWSTPVYVSGSYASVLRLVRGKDGVLVAVWHTAVGGHIYGTRSADDGMTWSSAASIVPENTCNYNPFLATDGKGNWILSYESIVSGQSDYDICRKRSTDNGLTWSAASLVNSSFTTDGSTDDRPSAVGTDGNGTWVITWVSNSFTGLPSGYLYLLFSRSTDQGVTWSPTAALSSVPVGLTSGYAGLAANPAIQCDGNGKWVLVNHTTSGYGGTGSDYDIGVSRSSDNGATWTPIVPLNSGATTDSVNDFYPILRTNKQGVWLAFWNRYNPTVPDYDVVFSKSRDNGLTWSVPTYVNSNGASDGGWDYTWDAFMDSQGRWFSSFHSSGITGSDYDPFITEGSAELNAYPASVDLGTIVPDAGPGSPVSVTLVNDGLATCTITGSMITGPDAAAFSFVVAPPTVTLGPDQSTTCSVQFDPSSGGLKTASVQVQSDDPDKPTLTVSLTGRGFTAASDWQLLH